MRTLFLHIGDSKTGSSYIQACLSNSYEKLLENGIDYYLGNEGEAKNWRTSVGNGFFLTRTPLVRMESNFDKVFLSSEMLFSHFLGEENFDASLGKFCEMNGFKRVKILLFIRNPISHAESEYQQKVKGQGFSGDSAAAFRAFRRPAFVYDFLTRKFNLPKLHIKVCNYANHRDNLMRPISEFLSLPEEFFDNESKHEINRSLTISENFFLRQMNGRLGPQARFLTMPLINATPEMKADRFYPSKEVQEETIRRLLPVIDKVNVMIPPEERYKIDFKTPTDEVEYFTFSREQIIAITNSFSDHISDLQEKLDFQVFHNLEWTVKNLIKNKNKEKSLELSNRALKRIDEIVRGGGESLKLQEYKLVFEKLARSAAFPLQD